VCVIGAGSSGIAAAQVLHARGIPFDCFEKGSSVGGNWRYDNDNGMSSAYRSLHINTSRTQMAYRTFPMPDTLADYPSHWEIAAYFDSYVDHFGFRDRISFGREVTAVEPAGDVWRVTVSGETRDYDAVLVANGHHWDERWPEPPIPGEFSGQVMHAHRYRVPDLFEGKRVVVLGIGNSACDIAVEASRVADKTFLAMRRGAYVIPKFVRGRPTDESSGPFFSRLPLAVQRLLFAQLLKLTQGRMTDYGLPAPDHKLLEAHPTISSDLLPRLGHGDITVKPTIACYDGDLVEFADGSRERVDVVVCCTGYRITFPFLDQSVVSSRDNRVALYRHVVPPDRPGLFFIGLVQPLGSIMPLAEAQSEWVADLLERKASLPSPARMRKAIASDQRRMTKRYVASKRHTIQVDFHPYLRTIARERRRRR
jgi:cation diffusion facilitator CzcD-associated flavoprotein CzcO